MVKERARPEQESSQDSSNASSLVVYNDDVNTFDHVIDTLIDVCKHDQLQAEQCTMIIHHKGKCVVKTGCKESLGVLSEKIHERDITAKVE